MHRVNPAAQTRVNRRKRSDHVTNRSVLVGRQEPLWHLEWPLGGHYQGSESFLGHPETGQVMDLGANVIPSRAEPALKHFEEFPVALRQQFWNVLQDNEVGFEELSNPRKDCDQLIPIVAPRSVFLLMGREALARRSTDQDQRPTSPNPEFRGQSLQ
jgi:hypothetical protein